MNNRWKTHEEEPPKYLFCDLLNTGHHYQYNTAVMKGFLNKDAGAEIMYYSTALDAAREEELQSYGIRYRACQERAFFRLLPSMVIRVLLLLQVILFARKNNYTLHLLYLDTLILPLFFLRPVWRGLSLTATLHWHPSRLTKRRMLASLLKSGQLAKLIVHGDYLRSQVLKDTGAEQARVCSIVYPNLHPASSRPEAVPADNRPDEPIQRPVLLCFGGLRYDKGIDLLLEAAGRLSHEQFSIVIAGREQDFTQEDLEQRIREQGLEGKVALCLEYIPDADVPAYFEQADLIVLPYRKMFSGQSGPLTEAAARGKVIIGPSHGEIGYCIEHYRLGVSFEAENIRDLGDKISYAIHNMDTLEQLSQNSEYKALIQPGIFEQRYYEELAG